VVMATCKECNGSGKMICPTCDGSGVTGSVVDHVADLLTLGVGGFDHCTECYGRKYVDCDACDGSGKV